MCCEREMELAWDEPFGRMYFCPICKTTRDIPASDETTREGGTEKNGSDKSGPASDDH